MRCLVSSRDMRKACWMGRRRSWTVRRPLGLRSEVGTHSLGRPATLSLWRRFRKEWYWPVMRKWRSLRVWADWLPSIRGRCTSLVLCEGLCSIFWDSDLPAHRARYSTPKLQDVFR